MEENEVTADQLEDAPIVPGTFPGEIIYAVEHKRPLGRFKRLADRNHF